ncbi:hypothetical protein PSYMO_35238, partial [Pseudomonas amygdali pv. mori str. 301020]
DDQIPFSPPPKPSARLSQPKLAMADPPMSETAPATDATKNSTDSAQNHGANFLAWLKGGVI